MLSRPFLLGTTCLVAVVLAIGFAVNRPINTAPSMTAAAANWLETLSDEQLKAVVYDYDSADRVDWHFIPKPTRKGLPLREMSDEQREAARELLASCLSNAGYSKVRQVMSLEALLKVLQDEAGGEGPERDPNKYYFTLFGKPSDNSRWGLSIEGHHLSLNFVVDGDQVVSSSPTFFAANPTIVNRRQKDETSDLLVRLNRGDRVLASEELVAFELVNSLSDEQLQGALISEEAPAEIRAAGEPQPPQESAAGLAFSKLDESQQSRLISLVRVYAGNLPRDVAGQRMAEIRESGWDEVHFAWAGATKPGIGHYYRIQGPTFLIEFVNTQPDAQGNPASHIHCVWRDPRGDFALPVQ